MALPKQLGHANYRDRKQVWRIPRGYSRTGHKRNTPKAQRDRITTRPVPAMVDPMRTLGHPPRGRRHR